MKFNDKELDNFLELRIKVPEPFNLENKILNYVATHSQNSETTWGFMHNAFSGLFSMKYVYVLSCFLFIGLGLGFNDLISNDYESIAYSEMFYQEENWL